eukprot:6141327-Pleurochrysis_carterae.AAC.2
MMDKLVRQDAAASTLESHGAQGPSAIVESKIGSLSLCGRASEWVLGVKANVGLAHGLGAHSFLDLYEYALGLPAWALPLAHGAYADQADSQNQPGMLLPSCTHACCHVCCCVRRRPTATHEAPELRSAVHRVP